MNSKKISKPILEQMKKSKFKIILTACIGITVVIASCLWVHQNNTQNNQRNDSEKKQQKELTGVKNEYLEIYSVYNETIADYNDKVHTYNALVELLSRKNIKNTPKTIIEKEKYVENTESNYDYNEKKQLLKEKQNQLNKEVEELLILYNELCLFSYNTAIEEYNLLVEKYNAWIIKLQSYNIANMPNTENIKDKITEKKEDSYKKWSNFQEICNDLETIWAETKSIETGYVDIFLLAYNSIINDYNIIANEETKGILPVVAIPAARPTMLDSAIPQSKCLSGNAFLKTPVFVAPARSASRTTTLGLTLPSSARALP